MEVGWAFSAVTYNDLRMCPESLWWFFDCKDLYLPDWVDAEPNKRITTAISWLFALYLNRGVVLMINLWLVAISGCLVCVVGYQFVNWLNVILAVLPNMYLFFIEELK